jgi:hypothetical protein|nr:hypothetical protein [uncultured Romboutsia sp.]
MNDNNTIDNEIIHKEIDLIQSCISRMANNSFLLKGWAVSLIAVILAIIHEKINPVLVSIILASIILCFWYLDAFFLRTERMYRELYNWVIVERPKNNREKLYDLNAKRFEEKVDSISGVMLSKTLRLFYGIPFIISIIILIYNLMPMLCKIICSK